MAAVIYFKQAPKSALVDDAEIGVAHRRLSGHGHEESLFSDASIPTNFRVIDGRECDMALCKRSTEAPLHTKRCKDHAYRITMTNEQSTHSTHSAFMILTLYDHH